MGEAGDYKTTGVNSFRLAVELFNRPQDDGRVEAVVLLLNHAFEMLLKGAILKQGGEIRADDGEGNTLGFEKCVNICRYGETTDDSVKCINVSEGAVLQSLNHQRDFAQHEQIHIQEGYLYLLSRQCIEIFEKVLEDVFEESLSEYLPERVLPLATLLPVDIVNLIEDEVVQIRELMDRDEVETARNRVKSLESLERGLDDEGATATKSEIDERLESLADEEELDTVFPHVFAALTGDEDIGEGRRIQFGSDAGIPATYIPEDEIDDETDVYLFTEKNLHDRYPLNPFQLRDAVREELDSEITWARCLAIMKEIGVLDNEEYHREDISLGDERSRDGYTRSAVARIVEAIEAGLDPDEAWEEHGDDVWHS